MSKYWKSFSELNETEAHKKLSNDEFQEELPFESADKGGLNTPASRRDFLKYLGFSTTAAAIAASCEMPVKKAIPFTNKPEDIIPGIAYYYATTYVEDGDAVSVLAKVRDGRPIKIEGNELSPVTQGGTSAKVQASVLDLYDTARLRFPTIDNKEVTLEAIDKSVSAALSYLSGAPIVILTSSIISPTTKEAINQFISKYPGSRHVMYDAVSCTGMLLANEASYGKKAIPSYRFDNAKAIVSIGADFLGTWISPIEFARQYSRGKKIDEKNPAMSRHVHFETVLSITGANADERYLHRPSETGAIALGLLNAVNGQAVSGISDATLKTGIEKAAKELLFQKGAALVVCGSNDVNIQMIINAINEALGAGGKTIDWSTTINSKQGIDSDFAKLLDEMNAGSVGALLIHGANPVYSWFDSEKVRSAIKKVRVTVSFNCKKDETTQLCKYIIPDHHYLECWGDAEPKSGYYSLMQPAIYPLFKTRQWQDSLLKWSGAVTDYLGFVKQYWMGKLGSEMAWNKALQDGVINPGSVINNVTSGNSSDSTAAKNNTMPLPVATGSTFNSANVATATSAINSKQGIGLSSFFIR
ncbi:MAG: TAT-variant-translocated molybdopterin oxidoreductase [Parafilimonas sp.]